MRAKVFDVLVYLVQHRDVVVTKEALLAAIWDDVSVSDDVVYRCVIDIRTALGDDRRQPIYIRTIPKTGYRFVAEVHEAAEAAAGAVVAPVAVAERTRRREMKWAVAAAAICAVGGILYGALAWGGGRESQRPYREVAWWRFDEGRGGQVADSSRSALQGSVTGKAVWGGGPAGGAVRFPLGEGQIDGWDRGRRLPRGSAPRSVTSWIRATSTGAEDTAILMYGSPGTATGLFSLFLANTGRVGFGYDISVGALRTSQPITDGGWHFVAATYGGPEKNLARIFVDGVMAATGSLPKTPETGDDGSWQIGGELASKTRFRGDLDDLRVFARTLVPAEVQALYRCSAKKADVTLPDGRSGYLMPVWGYIEDTVLEIGPGAVKHRGEDYAAVQFAVPVGDCGVVSVAGTGVGDDLRFSMDVKVPATSPEDLTTAGPYFRSRTAGPRDGLIGGTSAGYWVQVDSTGVVRVRRLNPHEVVAFSAPVKGFDGGAFHRLDVAAHGEAVEVALDGRRVTFEQAGAKVEAVAIPPIWMGPPAVGSNEGAAGIAFSATRRTRAGGQEIQNLKLERYRPIAAAR